MRDPFFPLRIGWGFRALTLWKRNNGVKRGSYKGSPAAYFGADKGFPFLWLVL